MIALPSDDEGPSDEQGAGGALLCLPSDDEGAMDVPLQLPSDDEGGLVLPPDDTESPLMFDDDGAGDGPPRAAKVRKVPRRFPGRSRKSLIVSIEMIPRRAEYLWKVQVPPHRGHDLQDDVMEVYSPARVLKHTAELQLRGDLSADLTTGWDPGLRWP